MLRMQLAQEIADDNNERAPTSIGFGRCEGKFAWVSALVHAADGVYLQPQF